MDKVLLTLNDEKMLVETIFKETIERTTYLYWYSVQVEGGIGMESSSHEAYKKHMEFWNEFIDPNYQLVDMEAKVVMIQ